MSINNGFLLTDGLHLSPQGSERLVKNFNVKASVRRSTRSICHAPEQIPNPHFQWQQRPSFVHNMPQNIKQNTPLHPIPSVTNNFRPQMMSEQVLRTPPFTGQQRFSTRQQNAYSAMIPTRHPFQQPFTTSAPQIQHDQPTSSRQQPPPFMQFPSSYQQVTSNPRVSYPWS